MPSASILFFRTNLVYVLNIEMYFGGECDLGVCMTSVLAKRIQLRSADFRRILRPNTFLNRKLALCGRFLFASTEVMHTPRSNFPLHIDMKNIHQIRTEKRNARARPLLQATPGCSSASRRRQYHNFFFNLRVFIKE